MNTQKLTPWFPGDIKPVHVGPYVTIDDSGRWLDGELQYRHWNGSFWGWRSNSPNGAFNCRNERALYDVIIWRGLAERTK